ncbi:MAG: DegV family protein [Acidimicrobiia bacterium]|nr:DegV family protein [Acidimicrobiia bacterium]
MWHGCPPVAPRRQRARACVRGLSRSDPAGARRGGDRRGAHRRSLARRRVAARRALACGRCARTGTCRAAHVGATRAARVQARSSPCRIRRSIVSVAIVTDSAAALPTDLATRCNITVVPMWLTVQGVPEPEGARPLDELVLQPEVTTSAPTPGEFERAIKERSSPQGVVVLTIASSMSATYQAAVVAAEAVGGPVRVVDTRAAGGAEALVVLAAAEAARRGASLDEVEARVHAVISRVRLVASVGTLDHLVRSGRVPGVAGWAGRRLGIKPLFEFRAGEVRRLRPALSTDAALDRIVALVHRSQTEGARLHVAALHALAPDAAAELLQRVSTLEHPTTAFVGEFGPVMVVHTGPDLAGLAWWWEEEEARGAGDARQGANGAFEIRS